MDDTRERLINAAGEVFAEKGFDQATVREICARANANIAAINYHFGDKERLYAESVKRAHCEHGQADTSEWPAHLTPEEQLHFFIRKMMEDMLDRESPSWHIELTMREMSRPTTASGELVREYIGPKFELLHSILRQLLPANMPVEQVRLHGFSIVGQCLLYRFHRPIGRLLIGEQAFQNLFDVDLLARHITEFSLRGLRGAHVVEEHANLAVGEAT
jgi:AcrR family transcriptional regulator